MPQGIVPSTGCSSPFGSGSLGLAYQPSQGDLAIPNSPRALQLKLGGCCGSGGTQQVWPQNGYVNRTYEIMHATGLGAKFGLTASYDSALVGENGILGPGWKLTAASNMVFAGSNVTVDDGNATLAGFEYATGNYDRKPGVFRDLTNSTTEYFEEQWEDMYYVYDTVQDGRITKICDLNGNAHTFVYDASPSGKLESIDFASGRQCLFTYDNNSKLKRIEAPGARITTFTYDSGKLSEITGPDGCQTAFEYHGSGRLKTVEDPVGNLATYSYDVGNRLTAFKLGGIATTLSYNTGLTRIADGNHNFTSLTYDSEGIIDEKDPVGNSFKKDFNSEFFLIAQQDRTGAVTYFDDDGDGNVEMRKDPLGNRTTYTWDGHHHLLRQDNPDNCFSTYAYDAAGNMEAQRNFRGFVTTYGYDRGQRVIENDPYRKTIEWGYNPVGDNITMVDKRGNTTSYTYDAAGTRTRVEDAAGNVTSYVFDKDDQLIREINARGYITSFGYDARGAMTTSTDRLENVTSFQYDAWRQLVQQKNPNGLLTTHTYDNEGHRRSTIKQLQAVQYRTTYTYDATGYLITQTDPRNNTTTLTNDKEGRKIQERDALNHLAYFGHDANGNLDRYVSPRWAETGNLTSFLTYFRHDSMDRLSAIKDPLGRMTTYSYDGNSNRTAMKEPGLRITTYAYDALDRLVSEKSPTGNVTTHGYDANGNRVRTQNPRGYTTTFIYETLLDRMSAVQNADGNRATYQYDKVGNTTVSRDFRGNRTTYQYDAMNRPELITTRDGTWAREYDSMGNLLTLEPPVGGTVTYHYDYLSRRTQYDDAAGGHTTWTYDGNNNIRAVRNPRNYATTYSYDALNRVESARNALNEVASYTYDNAGNLKIVTDPLLSRTTFSYDQLNRVRTIKGPASGTVTFSYDLAGNLNVELDARGFATTYVFDKSNRLTEAESPHGNLATWAYDADSNLKRTIDGNGVMTTFGYDALDRRTSIQYPLTTQTFGFDKDSNLIAMEDGWGVTYFVRDPMSRLVSQKYPNTNVVSYTYLPGTTQLASLKYPQGAAIATYSYDTALRLDHLKTAAEHLCTYQYDPAWSCKHKEFGNGVIATYTFDPVDRVESIEYAGMGSPQFDFATLNYSYDTAGRIEQIQRLRPGSTFVSYYGYDTANRLTSELWVQVGVGQLYGFQYGYDLAGNRTSEVREQLLGPSEVIYYELNEDNTLKWREVVGETVTYYYQDGNGACIKEWVNTTGDTTYFTPGPNQMITSIEPPGASPWQFSYDGQFNRYKIDKGGGDVVIQLWDGLNLLEERTESGDLLARFTHGYTPIYGIGSCVEVFVPGEDPEDDETYTLLMDHRGSVNTVLDDEQNIIATREYNAFGETIAHTGVWPERVPFGYQSNWQTVEIDGRQWCLTKYGMYDNQIGGYVQHDPFAIAPFVVPAVAGPRDPYDPGPAPKPKPPQPPTPVKPPFPLPKDWGLFQDPKTKNYFVIFPDGRGGYDDQSLGKNWNAAIDALKNLLRAMGFGNVIPVPPPKPPPPPPGEFLVPRRVPVDPNMPVLPVEPLNPGDPFIRGWDELERTFTLRGWNKEALKQWPKFVQHLKNQMVAWGFPQWVANAVINWLVDNSLGKSVDLMEYLEAGFAGVQDKDLKPMKKKIFKWLADKLQEKGMEELQEQLGEEVQRQLDNAEKEGN